MLDSVIVAFQQGYSPETIRQQYPALTLEEVYGSIAYYLAHAEEVNSYLRQQDEVWKNWESKEQSSPVAERLRALSRARVADAPGADPVFSPITTSTNTLLTVSSA